MRHYEKYHDLKTGIYLGVIYIDGQGQWRAERRDTISQSMRSRDDAVRWLHQQLERSVAA